MTLVKLSQVEFYSPFLHDFAGKGEYNVLRGVSTKWYLLF